MRSHLSSVMALVIVGLCAVQTVSATDVGGTLNANASWTTNDSPYVVTNDLLVNSGVVLSIDPGVEVQIYEDRTIIVDGSLLAVGTELQPIRFTRYPPHPVGGGFFFRGEDFSLSVTGRFVHCNFEELAGSPAMLVTLFSIFEITDSTVSNIDAKAILPRDSDIHIVNNVIHDTLESINEVRCRGLIVSNHIFNVGGNADAIDLDLAWEGPGDPTIVVAWNLVEGGPHSNADGIDFGTSGDVIVRNNIIHDFGDKGLSIGEGSDIDAYNNLIYNCNIGIAIKDSSTPRIGSHTIANCNIGIRSYEKNSGDGGGLGSISNSIIWDCDTSISLEDDSTLDVGYCIVKAASTWPGPSNSNADPQFQDPSTQDYRLRLSSVGRDSGLNMPWMVTFPDLDGEARIQSGVVDRGAYEVKIADLSVDLSGSPIIGDPPLEVVFSASVAGTNTTGLNYAWDFDADGTNDLAGPALSVVTNTYTAFGRHSVALTISNAIGETAFVLRNEYVAVSSPSNIYVSLHGAHISPFTNWVTAATNIESAVANSLGGTRITVSNGTYRITSEIVIDEFVILESLHGPAATIVDAQDLTRCFTLDHADAVIDGFTLTRGSASVGAAAFIDQGTMMNCVVVSNQAVNNGGGVYLDSGAFLLHSVVTNNTAGDHGGGLYMLSGGQVEHSRIVENRTLTNKGGGVYAGGGGLLRNCLISGNTADDSGGGVYCDGGGTLESCTLVANSASDKGGGVRCSGGGTILNSIIYFNTAPTGPNRANKNGGFSYTHTCTTPAIGGLNNVSDNPLFVSATDLHLQPGSPCINTGLDQGWMSSDEDLDGEARVVAGTVDMGVFESAALGCTFTADSLSGFPPLQTVFTATPGGTNLESLVYRWDFDNDSLIDLAGEDLALVTNVYTTPGDYSVMLTLSNAIGEVAACLRQDYITVAPGIVYVATNGAHVTPFSTWLNAATNIQEAVTASANGTLILVSNGRYRVQSAIVVDRAVTIRGVNGPSQTILDGNLTTRCLHLTDPNALIEGFTITRGSASQGGGVLLAGGGTLSDCIISSNSASGVGGGIYCQGGGTVRRCSLLYNHSTGSDGGGAFMTDGVIQDSVFMHNQSDSDDGGGIEARGGLISRCTFKYNQADDKGGGILLRAGATAESCLVVSNSANLGGGFANTGGGGTLRHCTLAYNRATSSGGGLFTQGGGATHNSIAHFNTAPIGPNHSAFSGVHTYSYTTTYPAVPGVGNATNAPWFANAAACDYQLLAGSPGIDAGTNLVAATPDLAMTPRPLDGNNDGIAIPDMGAYEWVHPDADSDNDEMPDLWEVEHGLDPTFDDAAQDRDMDGMDNGSEFAAGTDPNDAADLLWISQAARGIGPDDFVIWWPTVSGRCYTVYRSTNLWESWTNHTKLIGTGLPAAYTNADALNQAVFFSIGVAPLP